MYKCILQITNCLHVVNADICPRGKCTMALFNPLSSFNPTIITVICSSLCVSPNFKFRCISAFGHRWRLMTSKLGIKGSCKIELCTFHLTFLCREWVWGKWKFWAMKWFQGVLFYSCWNVRKHYIHVSFLKRYKLKALCLATKYIMQPDAS